MGPGESRRWKDVHGNSAAVGTEIGGCKDVGIPETIYEEYEGDNPMASTSTVSSEEIRNVVMVMNMAYNAEDNMQKRKSSGLTGSSSSSSAGSALQRNIWAWCEATGLPTSVIVQVEDCTFKLHKYPLVSKSGYLKRNLCNTTEVTLSIPLEIFELVANFCYGSTILMDPFNVAALRCAAEFLEMTDEFGRGNLCERSDLYLTQVVLQSWEDTLVVLEKCEDQLPLAEEVDIVSRCIDSLACMACMEVLEPRQRNVKSAQSQFWSDISVSLRQTTNREWWIKDLLVLSLDHFERIVVSMRNQGMEENIISQVIVQYSTKWILLEKRHQDSSDKSGKQERNGSLNDLLECITRLLPVEGHAVPVDFLFSLLRVSLGCNLSSECRSELEARIASQLECATIENLSLPTLNSDTAIDFDTEVETMKRIISFFMYQQSLTIDNSKVQSTSSSSCSLETVSSVANLWDEYLAQIAYDKRLSPSKFSELIGIFPPSVRSSHDFLYKAIHTYLTAHPQLSHDERLSVCKFLKVQKLSQEACVHAVQNELMPLRLIVQAMFLQQVQTRESIWPNAGSMSFGRNDRIDSLSFLQRTSNPSANFLPDNIMSRIEEEEEGMPLGLILKRDAAFRQAAHLKSDYEATSLRLRNLEEELVSMKKNLETNKKEPGKSRNTLSGGKSESFRVARTTQPVDTGCSLGFGSTITSKKKGNGKLQKLWKSFQRLSFRKAKSDQNIEIQEPEPDIQVEVSVPEINQNIGHPQFNRRHRRNYSFS